MRGLKGVVPFFFFVLLGCSAQNVTNETVSPSYRWMDRTIYFAYPDSTDPDRNSAFDVQAVQTALNEIATNTSLGQGYFTYQEVDESVLQPINSATTSDSGFISFILIWPDSDFSNYVVNELGGDIPDPNVITVLNSADKRQFYMIFKASCFESGSDCGYITKTLGLQAMVARQLGVMSGMNIAACPTPTTSPLPETNPSPGASPSPSPSVNNLEVYNVMCASNPSDDQWSNLNQSIWDAAFDDVLEAILNNPDFYQVYQPPLDSSGD